MGSQLTDAMNFGKEYAWEKRGTWLEPKGLERQWTIRSQKAKPREMPAIRRRRKWE